MPACIGAPYALGHLRHPLSYIWCHSTWYYPMVLPHMVLPHMVLPHGITPYWYYPMVLPRMVLPPMVLPHMVLPPMVLPHGITPHGITPWYESRVKTSTAGWQQASRPLRRKFAPLSIQTGSHDVSAFLSQNSNKLPFSFMNYVLFMSRLAVTLLY